MSLFEPLVFPSGLVVRNRAFLAPLTNKQSRDDGSLSDDELRWMCSRAEGGFGLVLGIFDDALLPGLTRLAAEIRQRGPASIFQLFHGGGRIGPHHYRSHALGPERRGWRPGRHR